MVSIFIQNCFDVKNILTSIDESFCLYLHLPWEIQDINGCLIRQQLHLFEIHVAVVACRVLVYVLATFLGISLAVSLQIPVMELI